MKWFAKKKQSVSHPRAEIVLRAMRALLRKIKHVKSSEGFSAAPDYKEELIEEVDESIKAFRVQLTKLKLGTSVVWKDKVLKAVDDALEARDLKEKEKCIAGGVNFVSDFLEKN